MKLKQICSVLLPYDDNDYAVTQEKDFLVLKTILNNQVITLIFSLSEIHGLTSSILLRHLK